MIIGSILVGSIVFTLWYVIFGPELSKDIQIKPHHPDIADAIHKAQVETEIWKNGRL